MRIIGRTRSPISRICSTIRSTRGSPSLSLVTLGDIDALVTHSLEGLVELEENRHLSQVGAERLEPGHQIGPLTVDFEIGAIDLVIELDDLSGELHVTGADRVDGHRHHLLGTVHHAEHCVLQRLQFLMKMKIGVCDVGHPNRPVM